MQNDYGVDYCKVTQLGTFECLNEPRCVFWGFILKPETAKDDKQKIIDSFNKYHLKAVDEKSKEASDLSNIVVSNTGIRTPFVAPEDAKDVAQMIVYITQELSGAKFFESMSYASALSVNQMAEPLEKGGSIEKNQIVKNSKLKVIYPKKQEADEIIAKYGSDFIERKLAEARNSDNLKKASGIKGDGIIFRGQPHARDDLVMFNLEGRAVNLGTASLGFCNNYPYIGPEDKESYAFVFTYKEYEGQPFVADFGFERGAKLMENPRGLNEEGKMVSSETPLIVPGLNEKVGEYLRFQTNDGMRYFPIPQNDPEWKAFKQLHTPADLNRNENLMDRVRNAKLEALENGGHPKPKNLLSHITPEVIKLMERDFEKISRSKTEQMRITINKLRGKEKPPLKPEQKNNENLPTIEKTLKGKQITSKDKLIALVRLSRGKFKRTFKRVINKTFSQNPNLSKGGRE